MPIPPQYKGRYAYHFSLIDNLASLRFHAGKWGMMRAVITALERHEALSR
jgi:hypothetical protein